MNKNKYKTRMDDDTKIVVTNFSNNVQYELSYQEGRITRVSNFSFTHVKKKEYIDNTCCS